MTVPTGGIELISHAINKKLNIPVSVLMGANLAPEVADEKFCETTIGSACLEHGSMLRDIIQTDYFRVVVVKDVEAVEMCGALKVSEPFHSNDNYYQIIQIFLYQVNHELN